MNYEYWQNALRGDFGLMHDGDAQPGFYRKRTSKAGPFVPVAIWEHEGAVVALVDGKSGDPAALWSFVCRYPVTEEQYRSRVETGKWHDEDQAVTESLSPPPARMGDNNPPTDEAEILKGQIDAATVGAESYVEIKDDETAAKAQSLRSRLLELSGTADKKREAEKKPHFEAGKAVDAKWQPLVKLAKEAADRIRSALGAHETRKAKEADERRRIAEEARVKAEAAAAKAAAKGKPAPAPPPPPPEPEPVQTQVRGAYGRAATIKAVKVAKVTNQDELYPFLKTHPELVDLMAKLAQRAVTAGLAPPGVEITEERQVA